MNAILAFTMSSRRLMILMVEQMDGRMKENDGIYSKSFHPCSSAFSSLVVVERVWLAEES
jgi:hypothetical protein